MAHNHHDHSDGHGHDHDHDHDHDHVAENHVGRNLYQQIDRGNVIALNAQPTTSPADIFKPWHERNDETTVSNARQLWLTRHNIMTVVSRVGCR